MGAPVGAARVPATTALLAAGGFLYGGGPGVVYALKLPLRPEGTPLAWQQPIDGTPLHLTASDNRLFVVCYASGSEAGGKSVAENLVLEILPDGSAGAPVRLPLAKPFTSYFTTTVRGGSPTSRTLEMLGTRVGTGNTLSYARVRLF